MRIAIHQPNYAPWAGYFAKMASVDAFVFLDNCQMPIGRSYVSRVQVRGSEGAQWMSIPVQRVSGQSINAVRFADPLWPKRHLGTLQRVYSRCPVFESVMDMIQPIYKEAGMSLADFNIRLIQAIATYLGVCPMFYRASELVAGLAGSARLIEIVRCLSGTTYVSGPGGTKYQDHSTFEASGMRLDVRAYEPVSYEQIHGKFVPGLSVLDAIFHMGPNAKQLLAYQSVTLQSKSCFREKTPA